MELTAEQASIVGSVNDQIVYGLSGTGKKTLIEPLTARFKGQRLMIITSKESRRSFLERTYSKVSNLRIETPFSLAYKRIGIIGSEIEDHVPDIFEIKLLLDIETYDSLKDLLIARTIKQIYQYFCRCSARTVSARLAVRCIYDADHLDFFWSYETIIINGVNQLIHMMINGKFRFHRSLYIKQFCLMEPRFNCDKIILENAHDHPGCFLTVIAHQKSRKLIFTDKHGTIHNCPDSNNTFGISGISNNQLTRSFVHSNDVTEKIRLILERKKLLYDNHIPVAISGSHKQDKPKTSAIISRHAITIIDHLLERHTQIQSEKRKINFMGGMDYYLLADECISLKECIDLYSGNRSAVERHRLDTLGSLEMMEDFALITRSDSLFRMILLTKKYKHSLTKDLREIAKLQSKTKKQTNRTLILSDTSFSGTVLTDSVIMLHDFMTTDEIRRSLSTDTNPNFPAIEQEINHAYKAASCARLKVTLPLSEEESITAMETCANADQQNEGVLTVIDDVSFDPDSKRKIHTATYNRWTPEEESLLNQMRRDQNNIDTISMKLKRSPEAILFRIRKLDKNK